MMSRLFYAYLFGAALVLAVSLASSSNIEKNDLGTLDDSQVEFEMGKQESAKLDMNQDEDADFKDADLEDGDLEDGDLETHLPDDDEEEEDPKFELDEPEDEETADELDQVDDVDIWRRCPRGWIRKWNKCYFFSKRTVTWSQAKRACRRRGSSLVKVNNRKEHLFLKYRIKNVLGTFWIGGYYFPSSGNWMWIGRFSNSYMRYFNWGTDQPYRPAFHRCAGMWYNANYKWAAFNCRGTLTYICEKRR